MRDWYTRKCEMEVSACAIVIEPYSAVPTYIDTLIHSLTVDVKSKFCFLAGIVSFTGESELRTERETI